MEEHAENKPLDEQPSGGKAAKFPAIKKPKWKLNVKEVGSQARVMQRSQERTELMKSQAMWWRPLLALTGVALLIVVAAWTASIEREELRELRVRHGFASISATSDGVLMQQSAGSVTAIAGMQVCDGDIFLTSTNSETTIRYATNDTFMTFRSNTLIRIHQKDGRFIELPRGNVTAGISKQPEGTNMVFMTPYAEITTTEAQLVFRVTARFARIEVNSGEAWVRRIDDKKAAVVTAGKYAVAAYNRRLRIGPLPNAASRPPETKIIVIP